MAKTDGFVRVPNWLIDDSDMTLHELVVYIVLLRFRDPKTGKCWPGITTIADRARVSRKTAIRAIKSLEERGVIRVKRRKDITENQSNVYEVSLAVEAPEHIWDRSRRGQRVPKRPLSDDARTRLSVAAKKRQPSASQAPGPEVLSTPSASEALPSASQSLPPVPPRHSKKNQKNKNHEQALTPPSGGSRFEGDFSFVEEKDYAATEPQVAYLSDLFTHLHSKSPDDVQMQRWRKLTRTEATGQISGYLDALGRPYDNLYPDYGTPEYEALSEAGKAFADSGGMPDSVWEYGFRLKENRGGAAVNQ